jgi:hypothetical protein
MVYLKNMVAHISKYALLAAIISASVIAGQAIPAQAQSRFNGTWSVLVITDAGDCDRAYRYGVRIERGRIYYEGSAGIDMRGRVSSSGRVTVTLRSGDRHATGSGRLSGNWGSGRWSGSSPTGRCSGHWEAERR